jgi:DNA-binding LacI/PurR family transcriptional regulator
MHESEPVSGKPTMKDIADVAGVSMATVSLVLNGKRGISESTRQRVLETARDVGYDVGRRLNGLPETISILIEHLPTSPTSDPFNRFVLASVEAEARKAGYRTVIEFATDRDGPVTAHWAGNWAAGVLILGGGDLNPEWIDTAQEAGLPIVLVDHFIPNVALPTVVPDNFAGAYAITRYLMEAGHRRIGFLPGPSKYWTLEERRGGYLLAMQQAELGPDPDLVPPRISHGQEKGFGETLALLDLPEPPTAIFAVSDQAAVGAYRAIMSRGLTVGVDISVVGFDDIEVAKLLTPPLTTVRNSGTDLGRVAVTRLLGMMRGEGQALDPPIKWTIPTRIIERQSVRKLE